MSFAGRPVFIEPWYVTDLEVEVAVQLGAPINGTAPNLWPLGYKSAGRRLFAQAGVPVPVGREDVRTVGEVVAGIAAIRSAHPAAPGVVIKHDNRGGGDGNVVLDLCLVGGGPAAEEQIRARYTNAAPRDDTILTTNATMPNGTALHVSEFPGPSSSRPGKSQSPAGTMATATNTNTTRRAAPVRDMLVGLPSRACITSPPPNTTQVQTVRRDRRCCWL
jgi:hypothetical protein